MLIDAFEAFKAHRNIAPLMPLESSIYYGPEQTRGPTSYPHIEWIPTSDVFDPPLWVNLKQIIDGKRVELESCFSRTCGVDIRLYHKDYRPLEEMINTVVNALYDVLICTGNFRLNGGRMMNREQVTENTVGYVLSGIIKIPIYQILPVGMINTTEEHFVTTPPS